MGKRKKKKTEIRLKGFTDDWEQRKLGEYLDVSNQKNQRGVYDKKDVLSVSGNFGIVNQIEICNMIRRDYQIIKWSKKMIL